MILSGKFLKLVDQDGREWMYLPREDVVCLTQELFYTIDYKPEEYPEYADLQSALDAFLTAHG